MQAELISIGNELLSGRTLNTHGRDLGEALAAIGLQLMRDTTIADDVSTIVSATSAALERTDLIFVSGGLGPTVDDITRDAMAKLLDQSIILHQPTVDLLAEWYAQRGRQMTPAAKRQALVMESAIVLTNPIGAAPGQRIDLDSGKTLFILPGPPDEFNALLNEVIIPWLKTQYPDAHPRLVRIVRTKGIGESDIVTILEDAGFEPTNIDLGFYPAMGKVEIRLTADAQKGSEITESEKKLRDLLVEYLDDSPENTK